MEKSRARLLSLVFLLGMIKCFCVLCYKMHKLMLHGVLRLTCRPLPGSWCFSIWSIPALWVQRGEPAVLSSLWAVQTFVHQLQPAKESQRHLHNLYPARSPPGGTHVHTQSYWLHWAACLLGTGIVIQVLFIFSSFCIANCCTAQSLCVIKKLVWVVQIWRYSVPSIAAFMWSWFCFFSSTNRDISPQHEIMCDSSWT